MIPSLLIHPDAAQDLRDLMVNDPEAAGKILALLQQAKHDSKILDSLLDHDFGESQTGDFHVSKWLELWNSGYNIWRLKIWTVPNGSLKQRIVYAYDRIQQEYHVLAVVHRKFDYKRDHAVTKRVLEAYRDLGIARY
jgi:hypothetical protein